MNSSPSMNEIPPSHLQIEDDNISTTPFNEKSFLSDYKFYNLYLLSVSLGHIEKFVLEF